MLTIYATRSRYRYRVLCSVCNDWFNTDSQSRGVCDPCSKPFHPGYGNSKYGGEASSPGFQNAQRLVEDHQTNGNIKLKSER